MRVAEEKGTLIGQEVGYRIRFDDCTDPQKTAIKVKNIRYIIARLVRCS
jgi:ATP-dependent RNA helicase DDX35